MQHFFRRRARLTAVVHPAALSWMPQCSQSIVSGYCSAGTGFSFAAAATAPARSLAAYSWSTAFSLTTLAGSLLLELCTVLVPCAVSVSAFEADCPQAASQMLAPATKNMVAGRVIVMACLLIQYSWIKDAPIRRKFRVQRLSLKKDSEIRLYCTRL